MRRSIQHWLDSPRVTVYAPLVTLAIGLFFVFVWAPHPWGWRGIDQYDALAKELALGEPFSTTDVPWGYTYYLAIFYRFFGEHTWAPVTGQVFINALTPLLLFLLARPAVGQRIAALAAWITAVFSFNTVYASTQSSDAICTVLFLLSLLCFVRGHTRSSLIAFAASGALSGIVPQFRPNMILLPIIVIGGYALFPPRGRRRVLQCLIFITAMLALLMPWIVRNYRYTGAILPTSTHGGIQLWYGTLQTGPYLESRAHNPRSAFASSAFPYTSLEAPIVISAAIGCGPMAPMRLHYRANRDGVWREAPGALDAKKERYEFEIPAQSLGTTLYYFFQVGTQTSPEGAADGPMILFITGDHLGDLDANHEMLDIFDVGRLARHVAGGEALPSGDDLDLNDDGATDAADLSRAIALLLPQWDPARNPVSALRMDGARALITLTDGSVLGVPPSVQRQTDFEPDAEAALSGVLVSRSRTMASLRDRARCEPAGGIKVNDVFYRREPHEMARYTALAFDNISRDPMAFVLASAYRMVRLFIIRGTDDVKTTHQFPMSHVIFEAGMVASIVYLVIFIAGVAVAWRARSPFLYALIPIAYVPLTICFVLTNMRYTITVQPLMFVFVAIAVAAVFKLGAATKASRT